MYLKKKKKKKRKNNGEAKTHGERESVCVCERDRLGGVAH